MRLLFDMGTMRGFKHVLRFIPETVTQIDAAIAYNHDPILVDTCAARRIQLNWWGLLDSENSTSVALIEKALASSSIKFFPFADFFHPKVIHFVGYGLYLGSANMTGKALMSNVEAGVFISDAELTTAHRDEVSKFFAYLRSRSIPMTHEDLELLKTFLDSSDLDRSDISAKKDRVNDEFDERFSHLFNLKSGVTEFGNVADTRRADKKLRFLQEWRETQNYISSIKKKVESTPQPSWILPGASSTIITDQFLHAYYYTYLLKGAGERKSKEVVAENFQLHRQNPERALEEGLAWWEGLESAPDEERHINRWGPRNREILSQLEHGSITRDELYEVLNQNHAVRNHARQIENKVFGLPKEFRADIDQRVSIYTDWLLGQKTSAGTDVFGLIRFILFDPTLKVEERIYLALNDEKRHIEHFGKSIIGELIGWGRPDLTNLRNNRVNKALRCLGYDVQMFAENVASDKSELTA